MIVPTKVLIVRGLLGIFYFIYSKICTNVTHLGWPSAIDLELGSVFLLKVSGSILSSANLRGNQAFKI
ncbi:transmembrane protein, putative [Medicago truncatula]|uniref:Transmembrane protein, putative n=1 Tax=Medicago truncatula TaxID=3880 RepID=G7JXT6_MEDTR|nr:transmembrane protein, putative [Medicago truncatula]